MPTNQEIDNFAEGIALVEKNLQRLSASQMDWRHAPDAAKTSPQGIERRKALSMLAALNQRGVACFYDWVFETFPAGSPERDRATTQKAIADAYGFNADNWYTLGEWPRPAPADDTDFLRFLEILRSE
jgi:hypothetical protein